MKFLRYISLIVVMLTSLGAVAQSSIDAAIAALQKSKSVTDEVFSERRDPDTRAVVRSSRMFNFDDDKMADKIKEAMKKERSKAVAFQMKTASGQEVYSISFEDSKKMFIKYVLIRQKHRGGWILSVDKSLGTAKDRSDCEDSDSLWFDSIPGSEDFIRQMTYCPGFADFPVAASVIDTCSGRTVIITTTSSTAI